MKKVILLALLMPLPAFGQIVDNFESQSIADWTQSTEGHWNADTASSLSGMYSLHHVFDNPDAGIDQIGIALKNFHPSEGASKWSFLVRYGYDPSSLNNWSVFLMSDSPPADMSEENGVKGFAVGVNYTGSDDTLRLLKIDGTQVSTIIDSRINWQTDIGSAAIVKLEIERSMEGNWTLSVSDYAGNLIDISSGNDRQLFSPGWFGVYYKYSSTKDRLFWIDDISIQGNFLADKIPPVITKCLVTGKSTVTVYFNEEPGPGIMIPENISLSKDKSRPVFILPTDNLGYLIEFEKKFINHNEDSIIISNLCDLSANCSRNVKAGFMPAWAETGDVIISEIMADPIPAVSLPGNEYIELTNRTSSSFNLKDWKLCTESGSALFPEITIAPESIIILCSQQDTLLFKKFGIVAGIKSFPILTDGGKIIYISDSLGNFIHGIEYSDKWYDDDLKSAGGWSLEMIDKDFPFYDKDNWHASYSKNGGTPGTVNSVTDKNPDNVFYGIQNVFPEDSSIITIRFSEPVFNLKENIKNIVIGDKEVTGFNRTDSLFREFSLKLNQPLKRSEQNQLEISGVTDFAGNPMENNTFRFGLTEDAASGDILFNEILFNPFPGDADYLELFNSSEKVLDASRLQLVAINDETGVASEPIILSDTHRCILPGEYFAVSTNPKSICQRYPSANPSHLFEIGSLPSMSDDKGHIVLFNRQLDKIDELIYSDDMQYSLLSDFEGVALEKIDPGSTSDGKSNWHSATESSGWGTPGAPNSVFSELPEGNDKIVFSSTKITPDNDGNEDFLAIKVNLNGNGNVVSATVFDEAGNFVRKLTSNLFTGPEASILWDGTAADGSQVYTGIYIILITLYDDTGKTEKWKKVCTVIRN